MCVYPMVADWWACLERAFKKYPATMEGAGLLSIKASSNTL
jgi:hypothetical protein